MCAPESWLTEDFRLLFVSFLDSHGDFGIDCRGNLATIVRPRDYLLNLKHHARDGFPEIPYIQPNESLNTTRTKMPILGLATKTPSVGVYPKHFDIEAVIRPNILSLQPYRCARDDYQSGVLLDANENALGHSLPPSSTDDDLLTMGELHRYPDPSHDEVKSRIAKLRGVPGPEYVFLGVGSDEVIDMLMRVCCAPTKEKILITPPTYGMYSVCAHVNDVPIVKIPLDVRGGAFQPQVDEVSLH